MRTAPIPSPDVTRRNRVLIVVGLVLVVGFVAGAFRMALSEAGSPYATRATAAVSAIHGEYLDMTPSEFRAGWEDLTRAQRAAWVDSVRGQRVRWRCPISDVDSDGRIALECSAWPLSNITVTGSVARRDVTNYDRGQTVTFEADIDGVNGTWAFTLSTGTITIIR